MSRSVKDGCYSLRRMSASELDSLTKIKEREREKSVITGRRARPRRRPYIINQEVVEHSSPFMTEVTLVLALKRIMTGKLMSR